MTTRQPTVEWQTNGVCNYDCSYCIQSARYRRGAPTDEQIDRFMAFFDALPGAWEIKMSGGEPFAFKGFMGRVIPGLAALRHGVSVLTNLSAPLSALHQFVDLVGHKLVVVSASLHLEYATADDFIAKAVTLRGWLRPATALVINNVLVPGTLEDLREVKRLVESAGLKYFPQVMKTKHGRYPYGPTEQGLVQLITGKNPDSRRANLAPSYKGRMCWSGVEYFALQQNGDGWSCRTAKRFNQGYLGNVLEGTFKLQERPVRCAYDICPCTVPANRGMIEGVHSRPSAIAW
jgi:MoaA/NifB/PqqE/SkfB family radical SAM enzyme